MTEFPHNYDGMIYQEMMSHPILYSHLKPQKIAIIGGDSQDGILAETLKHSTVTEISNVRINASKHKDKRVHNYVSHVNEWLNQTKKNYFDILIMAENSPPELFLQFFNILNSDGILLQQSESFFHLSQLKSLQTHLKAAGFSDVHPLHFPQPNFTSGWRAALMAKKTGIFKKIREKDIFNKSFPTHYYNFDTHKAALVVPEFMREELIK